MASPRDDSPQLQSATLKAAKSSANGTKEMPPKQPLEYVFQPGEQIIVKAKIGMWPGIFESHVQDNPDMIIYTFFPRKKQKENYIIQKDSIFPFPLEKIEAASKQGNSSKNLMEALRDALAYARERIAQNAEKSSKQQPPTALAQTPKDKIKQETATPVQNIQKTPSVIVVKQKTVGRLIDKRKIMQDTPKSILITDTNRQSSMSQIQPSVKRVKFNIETQDEKKTGKERQFALFPGPGRHSPSVDSSTSIISISTSSQHLGEITSALDIHPPLMQQTSQFSGQSPPMIDQSTCEHSKMEKYVVSLQSINTREDLTEFMWSQGYDTIPPTEQKQLLFNEVLQKREGLIGASTLYQIVCYGHPRLETYYCEMCKYWTTVSEMFIHLQAPMHRLNYMFRNYKMYYQIAIKEADEQRRDMLLHRSSLKIWKAEKCGQCTKRMRCILNAEAIRRIWPECIIFIDNSWTIKDEEDIELFNAYYKSPSTRNGVGDVNSSFRPNSVPHQHDSSQPQSQPELLEQESVRAPLTSIGASNVAKKLEISVKVSLPQPSLVGMKHKERMEDECEKLPVNNMEKNSDKHKEPCDNVGVQLQQECTRKNGYLCAGSQSSSSQRQPTSRLYFGHIPVAILKMTDAEDKIHRWLVKQKVEPLSILHVFVVSARFHNVVLYPYDSSLGFFHVEFRTVEAAEKTRTRLNKQNLSFDDIKFRPAVSYAKPS